MTNPRHVPLLAALWVAAAVVGSAQRTPDARPQGSTAAVPGLRVTMVRDQVHLIAGAGGNVVAQAGPEGVFLVDSGSESMAEALLAATGPLARNPIQYIVNTTLAADHVGGNAMLRRAGTTFTGGNATAVAGVGVGSAVIAHEHLLRRASTAIGGRSPVPEGGLPTDTFYVPRLDLHFNDEAIEVIHQPNTLSDGDVIVHFRRADVIATGDVFRMDHYPVIDLDAGGSIDGVLAALNGIIDITVPKILQEGGTLVVPGHGRIGDESEVVAYRDMLTIIRDRVAEALREGKTLAAVRAERPTMDYDRRWSASAGPASTDGFVEIVYRSLAARSSPATRR